MPIPEAPFPSFTLALTEAYDFNYPPECRLPPPLNSEEGGPYLPQSEAQFDPMKTIDNRSQEYYEYRSGFLLPNIYEEDDSVDTKSKYIQEGFRDLRGKGSRMMSRMRLTFLWRLLEVLMHRCTFKRRRGVQVTHVEHNSDFDLCN